MGIPKDNMAKSRLKPRGKSAEMRTIALALGVSDGAQIVKLLESEPEVAKLIGEYSERARVAFAAAYPGQTREQTISNGDWGQAGYSGIVGLNRILGLESS